MSAEILGHREPIPTWPYTKGGPGGNLGSYLINAGRVDPLVEDKMRNEHVVAEVGAQNYHAITWLDRDDNRWHAAIHVFGRYESSVVADTPQELAEFVAAGYGD